MTQETMLVRMVWHCARCGHDHANLLFRKFEYPIVDCNDLTWDWWATCPQTGDPILMYKIDGMTEVKQDNLPEDRQ